VPVRLDIVGELLPAVRKRRPVKPRRRAQRARPDRRRRLLELLAASRDGCTESILIAHGFTIPQMVELVRGGLATAERVIAGKREIEIARVRITAAGRRVITR
jgi:hypothetical protein